MRPAILGWVSLALLAAAGCGEPPRIEPELGENTPIVVQEYGAAELIPRCGKYDFRYAAKYEEHCRYDMYQRVCASLAERVDYYIEHGAFDPYAKEAATVGAWIADHYEQCFAALENNNSKTLPEVASRWELGDFGELRDVAVLLDSSTEDEGGSGKLWTIAVETAPWP